MEIEVKDRLKNWQFYIRIVLITFLPILALMTVQPEQINTWQAFGNVLQEFLGNPFLIGTYLITLYQSFVNSKNKE